MNKELFPDREAIMSGLHPQSTEANPEPRDSAIIEMEMIERLRALAESGGVFYMPVMKRDDGTVEKAIVDMHPTSSLFWAVDESKQRRPVGNISNMIRAITGGQQTREVIYESAQELSQDTIEALRDLDIENLTAMGYTGLALFHAANSIKTEPEGRFEPEKFLSEPHREFRSMKDKLAYFWSKFGEQLSFLNQIIQQLEQSDPNKSGEQLIQEFLGDPEKALTLSREQRYNLKIKIFNLVAARRKMDDLFQRHPDPKELARVVRGSPRGPIKGNIEVKRLSFFIQFFVENEADYKFLYAAINTSEMDDTTVIPDSGGFKNIWENVPITFIKGKEGGVPLSTERRKDVEDHEQRHAKNEFLLPDEVTDSLRRAKDEITAYLQEGDSTLRDIKRTLTNRRGLYTYDLQGEQWEAHVIAVEHLINMLAMANKVNLDALALMPIKHWHSLIDNMEKLVQGAPDNSIVKVKGGTEFKREAGVQEIAKNVRTNPAYTLVQAELDFNKLPKVAPDDEAYSVIGLSFDLQFEVIKSYLYNFDNLAAINLQRDTSELVHELELVKELADYERAWDEIQKEPDLTPALYVMYLKKLLIPLLDSSNDDLQIIANEIIASAEKPSTVTLPSGGTKVLNTWKEKIEFAKSVMK